MDNIEDFRRLLEDYCGNDEDIAIEALNRVSKFFQSQFCGFKKQGTSGLPEVTDNILSSIHLHPIKISSAAK